MEQMTEKEKMLNGDYYNSRDPELLNLYYRARKLLKTYNNLDAELAEKRQMILSDLFGEMGTAVWIETPFFVIMVKTLPLAKTLL